MLILSKRIRTPTYPAGMMKFSYAVHLLPVLYPLLICVTILTPYIIAVSLGHVYPFLPSISKTAAFQPEGSIFGFLMTFVAFFGLLAILCRYLKLNEAEGDIEQNTRQTYKKMKWFNKVSLPFGVSCIVGVVVVLNFRSPLGQQNSIIPIGKVHDAGTALLFVSGILYYWFQTVISYHAIKVGLNTKCTFYFRLAVSCILTFTGVAFPFFKWFSYTLFNGRVEHWKPKDGGYALHVANCTGEWITCLCLAIYTASYYKEFQNFSLEVCCVENAEMKTNELREYSQIKQHSDEDEG